jgi:ribonuclease HI
VRERRKQKTALDIDIIDLSGDIMITMDANQVLMPSEVVRHDVIEVFFDGLCLPINPGGVACYAYLIKKRDGKLLHSGSGIAAEPVSPQATNNVAEYTALLKALEWLVQNGYAAHKIEVRGDSQLVIKQMNGEFRVKNKRLIPLFQKAVLLKGKFKDLSISWIPREQNREADRLSERAYNNVLLENPFLVEKIKRIKTRDVNATDSLPAN